MADLFDLAKAYFGYKSAKDTNKANKELARDQNQFQIDASNTAYVRAAKDLKSAGINPILAAQFGGASTPSGSLANMVNPVQGANMMANTGKQIEETDLTRTKKELEKLKLPEAKVNAAAFEIILAAMKEAEKFGNKPEAKELYQSVQEAAANLNNKTFGFIKSSYEQFLKIDAKIAAKYKSLFEAATKEKPLTRNAGKSARRLGRK